MAETPSPRVNQSLHAETQAVLHDALVIALPDLQSCCRDPWTVIGSAAAWLVGAEVVVADLDVFTSVRDAETLIDHWQANRVSDHAPAGADRFRSHFARFAFSALPVEVMGGLEVFGTHGWEPLRIDQTITVDFADLAIPVPTIEEQIRVLKIFGRPKDLQRVTLLESIKGSKPC